MRGVNFALSGSENPLPVMRPEGMPPMQYDVLRRNSFHQGSQAMRDKFIERMTWFAEYAPNRETADYVWRIIMDVKEFRVSPEDMQ